MMKSYFLKAVAFLLVICLMFTACSTEDAADDALTMVQNGYLGEYSDISVKDLFDSYYGVLYEDCEWDSGTTNADESIVQVKYYDEADDENCVTVQFKIMDEECFRISAFTDPMEPIEKSTDLMAKLNYLYLLAYVGSHREEMNDDSAMASLIERLDQISGSAVLYGASSSYEGNRALICEKDGESPLDVSTPWLLDSYGLLDMSVYYDDSDVPTTEGNLEETMPNNDDGKDHARYDLFAYERLYENASICIDLTVMPNETTFYCYLHWYFGNLLEEGVVEPGVPAELSGGTIMTLNLNEDGTIGVTLDVSSDVYDMELDPVEYYGEE